MCHYIIFHSIPSACLASPRHVIDTKIYFVCDIIANDPDANKEHCDAEDCESIGEMGSSRVISDCSGCVARVVEESVLESVMMVCFLPSSILGCVELLANGLVF
ncbi:hypothetical protein ASPWEDRAFT_42837 [Aspergillus wentii DTO 134E9]|uniref:Uncharacterized protein n=1 Tax=Aspergillus wentii DTO 134E9 TaxID=1073089 RepID=A0A1L9RD52_ASPWE|nr:uncharacterized protein ASPWEDRAFT_42837 [Aspergillus wentii DTO 134E9]OJJ32808.1 hypothetical protein ASPWEDRAFT_42837 [Aspergillus wentii DTO 134E9]